MVTAGLKDNAVSTLAGNAMHLGVVGTLLAYVLSSTQRTMDHMSEDDGVCSAEVVLPSVTFDEVLMSSRPKLARTLKSSPSDAGAVRI